MPNWAFGTVQVTGQKKNIECFIKDCFLWNYGEIVHVEPSTKFFARTHINDSYEGLFKRFDKELQIYNDTKEVSFEFNVEFAWSANSCMIDGYPQQRKDECIDLPTACVLYDIEVEVWAEEDGMCFEEHIMCDSNGDILFNETMDTPLYICNNCENQQHFSSSEEEYICYECESSGIENWTLEK